MTEAIPSCPVSAGDVLLGKYRVERVLGAGGMGVVVAATHLGLDERVALKFLLPEIAENGDAVARFLREARAAAKIKSEHVADVKDVGSLESGAPYMVMEYLEGEDLGRVLERGALPIEVAADYTLQAIEAIAEAHALGIVHRDLKPQNLFVTRRPDGSACIKVLDFGIAKTLEGRGPQAAMGVTTATALLGTPLYMSPEQLTSSRDVDARSDVWALGVILFEMLAQRAPFSGDTMPQLCGAILASDPASLSSSRADAPRALVDAISRTLAKRPSERFQSVAELAAAIAPFASPEGALSASRASKILAGARSSGTFVSGAATAGAGLSPQLATSSGLTLTRRARRPKATALTGALVVLSIALVAIAFAVFRSATATVPAASEPPITRAPADAPGPTSSSATDAAPAATASSAPVVTIASAAPSTDAPVQAPSTRRPSGAPRVTKPPKSGLDLPEGRR